MFLPVERAWILLIQAVVFDLDDTLVDSWSRFDKAMLCVLDQEGISYDRDEMIALTHPQGIPPTAALFSQLGVPGTVEEITERIAAAMYAEYAHGICLTPGAETYLRQLRAEGMRVYVLTASPHSITDVCLQNNGVYDWFDRVWSTGDFGLTKAQVALFDRVAEEIGLPAEEILYYDDNPVAVSNAATAGYAVCGVLCPYTPYNDAAMRRVTDACIASFEEVI